MASSLLEEQSGLRGVVEDSGEDAETRAEFAKELEVP
jgi:hypothetical protein